MAPLTSHELATKFEHWLGEGIATLLAPTGRLVVILRPGAEKCHSSEYLFKVVNNADDDLGETQIGRLKEYLLANSQLEESCVFALYGGYMSDPPGPRSAPTRLGLHRATSPDTPVYFGTGLLTQALDFLGSPLESLFAAAPDDLAWVLRYPPDLPVVLIQCDDQLSAALISDPLLQAIPVEGEFDFLAR